MAAVIDLAHLQGRLCECDHMKKDHVTAIVDGVVETSVCKLCMCSYFRLRDFKEKRDGSSNL